jgi:hypothetical protein
VTVPVHGVAVSCPRAVRAVGPRRIPRLVNDAPESVIAEEPLRGARHPGDEHHELDHRKRSKTAKQKDVPVVNYLLWPGTFDLLKQHRSGQGRVLLTESGQPWVWQELVNGKKRGSDNFRSNFTHLQDTLKGFNKPPKLLRKTAATLLDSHSEYSRYSTLFLGHSPRSIADRHYVKSSQKQFDEAVLWLGRQLGQVQ